MGIVSSELKNTITNTITNTINNIPMENSNKNKEVENPEESDSYVIDMDIK